MADKETEQEWAKLRRIEAEKEKARQAVRNEKPDAVSLSYLDPKKNKVKGWSTDRRLISAKTEKLGTWSVVLMLAGIALTVISVAGSVVGSVGRFGMGGIIISGIPGGVGLTCMGVATFFAAMTIPIEWYYKVKDNSKFSVGWWSAIATIILLVIFMIIAKWVIF